MQSQRLAILDRRPNFFALLPGVLSEEPIIRKGFHMFVGLVDGKLIVLAQPEGVGPFWVPDVTVIQAMAKEEATKERFPGKVLDCPKTESELAVMVSSLFDSYRAEMSSLA